MFIDDYFYGKEYQHAYEAAANLFDGAAEKMVVIKPDFFLPNFKGLGDIYLEHFGLQEVSEDYREKIRFKFDLYRKNGKTVICTYEDDMVVGLFFLISGFFLSFSSPWDFLKSKFLRIYFPYAFTTAVVFLVCYPVGYPNYISWSEWGLNFLIYPLAMKETNYAAGNLWFVVYLWIFYTLYFLLNLVAWPFRKKINLVPILMGICGVFAFSYRYIGWGNGVSHVHQFFDMNPISLLPVIYGYDPIFKKTIEMNDYSNVSVKLTTASDTETELKLSDYFDDVDALTTTGKIDFKTGKIGDYVLSYLYDKNSDVTNFPEISYKLSVVEGYNITNAKELNVVNNQETYYTSDVALKTSLDNFRTANNIPSTDIANVVIQNDIEIRKSDLPDYYVWQDLSEAQGGPNSADMLISRFPLPLFLWFFAALFTVVLAEVLVAALLSVPGFFVSRFLRQNSLIELIVYVLLFASFIGVVSWLMSLLPNKIDIFSNWGPYFARIQNFLKDYRDKAYPLYCLTLMMVGFTNGFSVPILDVQSLWAFLSLLGIILVAGILVFWLVSKLYLRLASESFEYTSNSAVLIRQTNQRSFFFAQLSKEITLLIKDPGTFMMAQVAIASVKESRAVALRASLEIALPIPRLT